MNTLSFRTTDDNMLSFELLVDGRSLGELVGAQDRLFPYRYVVDDLPRRPPHGESRELEVRIVCCCECGEYGCGHTQCRVVREGEEIVFRDFEFETSPEGRNKVFRFPFSNYHAIVSEIVALAQAQQNLDKPGTASACKSYFPRDQVPFGHVSDG